MKLFSRIINTEIIFEKCIGLAIGYTSYKKSSGIRCTTYSLVIPFIIIEIGVRYNPPNKLIFKKKKKTFIAKLIAMITLFCGLMAGTALYEAARPSTDIYGANALIMVSVLFTTLFVVLGISYLSMDPNEKYKNV
jgi:hypothetical protein